MTVEKAIKDFKEGKFLIIVDDKDREDEGDLAIAAEKISSQKINFMISKAKGLVCISMTPERLDELKIPLMVKNNTESTRCQFTVSVDHKDAGTGISAGSRALTIRKLVDKGSKPEDFLRPGHVFPLRYNSGGLRIRQGHTEASIELCKLSGLYPAAVICEIIKEDGKMARIKYLEEFSKKHNIRILKIRNLLKYLNF